MSEAAVRLMSELEKLSSKERAEVAYALLESLEETPSGVFDVDDPEFEAELARRVESVRNGTAELEPSEKVMAELLKKYS